MGLLHSLKDWIAGTGDPVADRAGLVDFIDARSAFIAQKCVVEFCRVRAGVYWQKLFSEEEFRTALAASCWTSFPPAAAMVAEMVEGVLREPAGLSQRRLPDALTGVVADVFARHPVPSGMDATFWAEGLALVRSRLEATQASAPRPVRQVAKPMAKRIHAALPIHESLVTHDYDYIRNNLRMNLLRAHEDLLRSLNARAVVDELLN